MRSAMRRRRPPGAASPPGAAPPRRGPSPLSLPFAVVAALLALLLPPALAYDFSNTPTINAMGSCQSAAPGSIPQLDMPRTNMSRNAVNIVAATQPVPGRKMVAYLGTGARDQNCFAGNPIADPQGCRYFIAIQGTWQSMRNCGWSGPTINGSFEIRTNTIWLEWEDVYPGNIRRPSKVPYQVSIALPTTVTVSANVTVLEESGIRNFNLTGISYENTGTGSKYLFIDFTMFSRWPNNLTLAEGGFLTTPGFPGKADIFSYQLPTCRKTDGSQSPFTTQDFCFQTGTVRLEIGDQCQVGGAYRFAFDTNCFPGAANVSDCRGKVLTAEAFVGSANATGQLDLDVCRAILNTVAQVNGTMVADRPGGYFFGDTVTLVATFSSPDLPIFESRLTELVMQRRTVRRTPNVGSPSELDRNTNTTVYFSQLGPANDPGGATVLGRNTNFSYVPGANTVIMRMVPNMLPAAPGLNYNPDSYLTTDDFDSITTFGYFAVFRIYFDSVASGGQRRRRLAYRQSRLPSSSIRQTIEQRTDVQASVTVPQDPDAVPSPTPVAEPAPAQQGGLSTPAVIGISIGVAVLAILCIALILGMVARRRRRRKVEEEEELRALAKERVHYGGNAEKEAPTWQQVQAGSGEQTASWGSQTGA